MAGKRKRGEMPHEKEVTTPRPSCRPAINTNVRNCVTLTTARAAPPSMQRFRFVVQSGLLALSLFAVEENLFAGAASVC